MTSTKSTSADGVEWDLSDLYEGPEDPDLEQDIEETIQKAEKFREKYKGKLEKDELSLREFKEAMKEYEDIFESINKISSFASLYHAMDTQDPDRGALLQKVEQKKSEVNNKLIFFELEWQSLSDEESKKYMESDELEHYESYLNNWRRYTPYMLSEKEEQIIESLQNTGKEAFKRLFDQTVGDITVEFEVEGESYEMVLTQALSVLYEDDREKRKAAADAVTESLKEENELLNFIFNKIVQNHTTICEFREYPDPMTPRNLDNRVDRETVD
ncbi:MAG: oligoendopeptidase F, partial [Candidatus Thermoplasmatota archaeon]